MAKMSEEMKEMKGWLENQGYRLWLRVFGRNPETDLAPRVYAEQGMVWQWKFNPDKNRWERLEGQRMVQLGWSDEYDVTTEEEALEWLNRFGYDIKELPPIGSIFDTFIDEDEIEEDDDDESKE